MRRTIRVVCFFLVLCIVFGFSVLAADNDNYLECLALISEIDSELKQQGTSINAQLQSYLNMLTVERGKCKSADDLILYDNLIGSTESLLSIYMDYVSLNRQNKTIHQRELDPDTELFYAAAVSAVAAWFAANGFDLSYELLNYAYTNQDAYSYYYPLHGDRVEYSDVFWACRNNYSVSYGTDLFPNQGDFRERDLYYSIAHFSWYRLSNSYIRIQDIYDFEAPEDWGTIENVAISVMYTAQVIGILTPYVVRIEHY